MTHDPIDTAWRIHGALTDWTGKVDAKASFALTIQSAVIAGVVALSAKGRRFEDITNDPIFLPYLLGLGLLIVGVFFAAWAVIPALRRDEVPLEERANYIYFGHLKSWDPAVLQEKLEDDSPMEVLSTQLVTMAQIAWKKHSRVQISMMLGGFGVALLVVAYLFAQPA